VHRDARFPIFRLVSVEMREDRFRILCDREPDEEPSPCKDEAMDTGQELLQLRVASYIQRGGKQPAARLRLAARVPREFC